MYQDLIPTNQRLLIVANRTPATFTKQGIEFNWAGGLVSGLYSVFESTQALWIGFCGEASNSMSASELASIRKDHRIIPVALSTPLYNKYYEGMSNSMIWPLCHYSLELMEYSPNLWQAYVEVNQIFCDKVCAEAQEGDYIWVHDYHLMLLPAMLRQARPDLRISYFHHIPFPSSEIFRALPHRKHLIEGLLGADLIGFHTYDYVRHFLTSVTRILGKNVEFNDVSIDNRTARVGAFPMGIDIAKIKLDENHPEAKSMDAALVETIKGKTVFLGIDRLDHTKGIPQRLLAFSQFLTTHPELVEKCVYLQICAPSREDVRAYAELKLYVERLIGQINGRHSSPWHTPIHYMYRSYAPEEVHAFMRLADIALVTPLRDGLNLIAKEFVACKGGNSGVLVLSEFTGAAAELGEAILVNPHDIEEMAGAMANAVSMVASERVRRMRACYQRVAGYNNQEWFRDITSSWKDVVTLPRENSVDLHNKASEDIKSLLSQQKKTFVFSDYDGTLVPIASHPDLATPPPNLKEMIKEFRKSLEFVIVSGRPRSFFDVHFESDVCHSYAEYGAFYRPLGETQWEELLTEAQFEAIKNLCLDIMIPFEKRVAESFIEVKERSLIFHYRRAEQENASAQAQELREILSQSLTNTTYSATFGKKTVEVRSAICQKSEALRLFLSRNTKFSDPYFVSVGDEVTDEGMYAVNPQKNISIHIGEPNFHARYNLPSPREFLAFLKSVK